MLRKIRTCVEMVTGMMNVLKTALWPKTIYSNNVIFTKIPMIFFIDSEQVLKPFWKSLRPQTANAILSRKNIAGSIIVSQLKLYYKTVVTRSTWCWNKNRHVDRALEHYGRSWGKPTPLWPFNFWQWYQKHILGEKESLVNQWCQ